MDPSRSTDRLRNYGFLLTEVSRRYVLRFEERASALSLTPAQCKALARLENSEGVSQARLAQLADVESMTMSRILDCMQADGLLERRADPVDRRAHCLYLTAKATPLLEEIRSLSELTIAEILSGIRRRERDAFINVLERMHCNACALDGFPAEPRVAAIAPPAARARNGTGRSYTN
jgi:DNA-binding MarR family transcriptional regulator